MRSALTRPSVVAAGGLIGGFVAARATRSRGLGGAVFAAAGVLCGRRWLQAVGPGPAAALGALYVAAMGGSHPLAHRIGPWPSVLTVTALTAAASEAAARVAAR